MLVQGDCTFCEGSGKCEECNGAGTNPHLNSTMAQCSHCAGSGVCPECDGSGKSPLHRHKKNALTPGLIWFLCTFAWFFLTSVVQKVLLRVTALIIWAVVSYVFLYRAGQRKKPSPPSRF